VAADATDADGASELCRPLPGSAATGLRPDSPVSGSMSGVTLVAIFAHPDDEALACGGTLARAVDAGATVVLVCASPGELGSISDPTLVPEGDLASVRRRELEESARTLGLARVHLLENPDGCLRWVNGLRAEIAHLLRMYRPDVVITFDVDGLYWHDDHIVVHERTTEAVASLDVETPALYYVSLPTGAMRGLAEAARAHRRGSGEPTVWGISPDAFGLAAPVPSFGIDVRDWSDRKLAAIRCHRSQMGSSPFDWIEEEDVREWLGLEYFRRASGDGLDPLASLATAPEGR
jgi:N-acetyl-1-D-myo-inositol-2-amino-2-deoxy-alpha-D-glucopyranoside deacetylase